MLRYKRLNFSLNGETDKKIDVLAEVAECNRSQVVRAAIHHIDGLGPVAARKLIRDSLDESDLK